MIPVVAGWLIVALFALLAYLMYARVLPALLAVPVMALAMTAIAGASPAELGTLVGDGSVALAAVYVTVIFGALLGRVTLETRIAETIVKIAAEFGGDRPIALALVLCAAVAALFTSLTGLGAIIAVGSIVLPIMTTVGVPRRLAGALFLIAFALGFVFNIAQWTFYTKLFGIGPDALRAFAFVLFAIQALVLVAFALVSARRTRGSATWAVAAAKREAVLPVGWWALVTPILPVVLFLVLRMNPIVAFALSALYGVLVTKPRDAVRVLVASAIKGVEDVAPAILLMIGIGMLFSATKLPAVAAALQPVVATIAPRSPLTYVLLFGVLSPLALYRGPLNPFGVGIGVYTVLAGLHVLPAVALVAAVMCVVQVQNACDPTNTQNVWVANAIGTPTIELTALTLPWQTAVATLGTIAATLVLTPAAAATADGLGLYAPAGIRNVIALQPQDGPLAAVAAQTMRDQIDGGWQTLRAITSFEDPSATDCRTKPFDAMAKVSASSFAHLGGYTNDVGIVLVDCAGWGVDEWHATSETTRALDDDGARKLAFAALVRLRTWTLEHPDAAQRLFARGLAIDPATLPTPTYLFSLYKTDDGYMRAFVRPGGPAWNAGLRTNDIVDKVDGKFWWEYGTFQTQRRAYDGKPHTFEVTRDGKHEIPVALGSPLGGS